MSDESVIEHLADATPSTVRIPEPGKALSLSAAIRIGAKKAPQGFGHFFSETGATCALGAAMDSQMRIAWETIPFEVTGRIIELNDTHRWTREEIADWVESQGY